jgi:hypothetical protein
MSAALTFGRGGSPGVARHFPTIDEVRAAIVGKQLTRRSFPDN